MKLKATDIKKIGIFRALQLGDMLCAVPAIRSLRRAYPEAEIILFGLPWAKVFVERFKEYFDGFIHFPGFDGLPEQRYDPEKFLQFVNRIRKENFDLILQMQGNGTIVNKLMFELNAKHIAGFYNDESCVNSDLFIKYPNKDHEIYRHLKLINQLGIDSAGDELEFPLFENDELELQDFFASSKKKYVIVHPGSRGAMRQWPPKFFAVIADYCYESGFAIVVTGTNDEKEITDELIKRMHHRAINFTGKTSLGAVALLIKNASMLVANCTGVSHIASALKTPSIIISMDGEPERWAPLDSAIHRVIDCSRQSNFNDVYTETVHLCESLKGCTI